MPSPPQRPSPREKKTVDVSTASEGCPARPSGTRGAVFGSVPRIRAPKSDSNSPTCSRALDSIPKTDIAGIILNRWGTRVLNSATRIFLCQRWAACAGGSLAGSPVRQHCIREYRFVGSGRSSFVDHRGQSCGRTVARSGSELNLLVFIVLVFFDLDP